MPFTLPASIIGMLLLLALLLARVIKTEHIREKSDYLLGNLPFFFIPASVSIINYADVLRENLLALVVVLSLIHIFQQLLVHCVDLLSNLRKFHDVPPIINLTARRQ